MGQIRAVTIYTDPNGKPRVRVTLAEGVNTWLTHGFEQRGDIYRAEDGDIVQYYCYDKPGGGYGGRRFDITMRDGSRRSLIGPWSSRAGVVNKLFPDRDACVEATDQHNCVCDIKVKALETWGIRFDRVVKWGDEVYYEPFMPVTQPRNEELSLF